MWTIDSFKNLRMSPDTTGATDSEASPFLSTENRKRQQHCFSSSRYIYVVLIAVSFILCMIASYEVGKLRNLSDQASMVESPSIPETATILSPSPSPSPIPASKQPSPSGISEPVPEAQLSTCGRNPETAMDAGCAFDVILYAWVPEKCFNETLSVQFVKSKGTTWFQDPGHTHRVRTSLVETGRYMDLWVSGNYGAQWCLYSWAKMAQDKELAQRLGILDQFDAFQCIDILQNLAEGRVNANVTVSQRFLQC